MTSMITGLDGTPDDLADAAVHQERSPSGSVTVCPLEEPSAPPAVRRNIGGVSRDDLLTGLGAAISAFCLALLTFGRLTSLSGRIGFAVFFSVAFVVLYAVLVSLTDDRPAVVDRVMTVVMMMAALVAVSALTWVIFSTVIRGRQALLKTNLYTQDMGNAGSSTPLDVGGLVHAMVGTLIIMSISLVLTVPLGLTCAVYLNETRSRLSEFVRTVVTAMTALPSILAGLFVFATWIVILGYPRSGFAASLAISLMMLPIIIRSADVVLRLVPGNLREASAALGAPQWRTIWHVVLPTARSGLSTAVILGLARGIGETAPVLLTSGFGSVTNWNPTRDPMMSLPYATYEFVRSGQPEQIQRGFASGAVLMILVLILFAIARVAGGRQAGHLSGRQRRRAAGRSVRDLIRIESSELEWNS